MKSNTRAFGALWILALIGLLIAACAPAAAPSPTSAPAEPAPTTAPAPKPAATAQTIQKEAAQPTAKPATKSGFDEQAVADFYKGKTVRIIVGFSAGGGYDTYSRVIAKHLGKYIPGNPTVIVENMPGAGSIVAANHMYNVAAKDGTIIGNISGPIVLEQLFETGGVEFDMAKFHPLAVPVPETYMMMVVKDAGITKFEQLLGPGGKEAVFGTIPGSTVEHAAVLVRDILGAKVQVVSGYQGTSKVRLAIENGEVQGFFNTWQSVKITNREEIDSGEWVILAQMGEKPIKDLPQENVPTIPDIAETDRQRQLLLFGTSHPNQFGKLYVFAPEVPADRTAALQAAFTKTFSDKEFLADAEQSQLEISPLGSDEIQQLIQEMLGMSEDIKGELKKLMKPPAS